MCPLEFVVLVCLLVLSRSSSLNGKGLNSFGALKKDDSFNAEEDENDYYLHNFGVTWQPEVTKIELDAVRGDLVGRRRARRGRQQILRPHRLRRNAVGAARGGACRTTHRVTFGHR